MAGLFGGARRAIQGRSLGDNLSLLGATLQDVSSPGSGQVNAVQARQAASAQQAIKQAALGNLNAGLFGGGQNPTSAPLDIEALAAGNLGPVEAASPQSQGLPSLRNMGPALIRAAQAGVDIGDYVSLLDKATPNVQVANGVAYDPQATAPGSRVGVNLTNVNGFQVDTQNPANANRFLPDLPEGTTPLYDAQGNVAGVRNIDGTVQAIAERERATNDARNASTASYAAPIAAGTAAGQAPYQIETVQGPDGRPITASRATLLGSGPIMGQSASDQAYGVRAATDRADREAAATGRATAATRMLPTLDRMEELLPNIISGLGSSPRLAGSRILGALGNSDAQAQAAATETFVNEARQVVAQIIGTFGANPTEGERKYAEKMAGADVDLTPQALQEGIRLARERAYRDINGNPGAQQPQQTGGIVSVTTPAQAQALAPGTRYRTPDGATYIR